MEHIICFVALSFLMAAVIVQAKTIHRQREAIRRLKKSNHSLNGELK